jgi:sugar O-acyltransferase (sialic acid O-acetyltransferase NeuD family)
MKNLVLFGGGLHANYCADILEKMNEYDIVGIIDSEAPLKSELYGYPVIGRQEDIVNLVNEHKIECGLISIGDNWSRKIVYDCIIDLMPGFEFINAIHPSVIIGKNVSVGRGVVAMAGTIINPNCNIGDFCFFATGAQLDHDSTIESFASISAGSVTGGKVFIGKYSAITLGVTVLDRIHIGENVLIGSGSLVLNDLPDNVLAYGSPAKIIKTRVPGEKYLKSN